MRRNAYLLGAIAVCLSIVIYFIVTTQISGGCNGYERFDRNYHLEEEKILYGRLHFYREGIAPIRINRISLVNEQNIPVEVKVFFCDRQGLQMTGGPISVAEFEALYGKNLFSTDQLKWVKVDEDFEIVVFNARR